jgi:hypothetical protein
LNIIMCFMGFLTEFLTLLQLIFLPCPCHNNWTVYIMRCHSYNYAMLY